jgi:hypothetical protein
LLYEIDQLYGLASYRSDILPTALTLELLQASQYLLLFIDSALVALVEARARLRDFCAWLRSVGSQIKASGTAANSVQRENAKKRRVPATIVHNMLAYLRQEPKSKVDNTIKGTTEILLGLSFADFLRQEGGTDAAALLRPASPSSVFPLALAMPATVDSIPSIPRVLRSVSCLADQVFAHPSTFLAQSIRRSNVHLPTWGTPITAILAMTTRLGHGGIDMEQVTFGEERPGGFFTPTALERGGLRFSLPESMNCRQWLVAAQAIDRGSIALHAFPLSWTKTAGVDFDDEDTEHGLLSDVHWGVQMTLPSECTIRDIAFYGDDGKSSSSSSVDSGSGQEGRQHLGLLVSRRNGNDASELHSESSAVELWLVPYDELEFSTESLRREQISDTFASFRCQSFDKASSYVVQPMPDSNSSGSEGPVGHRVVYARTREVFAAVDFETAHDEPCRFVVSGSRGIGAALAKQQGGTVLEVFDLEEDEEDEDAEAEPMEADDGQE